MKLTPTGIVITLDIGMITGTKRITAEDLGLDPHNIPEEITLGTKRILPKPLCTAFRDLMGKAEYQLRKHSLAIPLGRFVPDKAVDDCLSALAGIREEYISHKRFLIDNLDQIASDWMRDHPELRLRMDLYPSRSYLEAQLRFNVGVTQFQFPEGLEAKFLGMEAAEEVVKSSDERQRLLSKLVGDIRANFDGFAEECSRTLLAEAAEIAGRLLDQIREGRIRPQTASAFRGFMDRFRQLNWMENEALSNLLGSAASALEAVQQSGTFALSDIEDNLRQEVDRTMKELVRASADQAEHIIKDLDQVLDEETKAEAEDEPVSAVASALLQGVL